MKSKSISLNILYAILGVMLFAMGAAIIKMGWFENITALPFILIGIGCGVFGHNVGAAIQTRVMDKNPQEAKKIRIEENDERNKLIRTTAKGKAFDAMVYVYGVVLLICALLNVDYTVILLLVGAYLLVNGVMVYQIVKLDKEM